MDVKPTLFIGLGTSGTEIIQHFRRHVFEEFQVAALPCFSYMTIETNSMNNGEDQQLKNLDTMEPEEKIKPLHIGIPDVRPLQASLREPNARRRWGDLTQWLHPQLLELSSQSFEDGAANTRMIGRLCLWYNWEKITRELRTSYNTITHSNAKDKTRRILRHYLEQKGRDNEVITISDHCDIYIVGTLCGGTCSGGFIDLAYFSRHNILNQGLVANMKDWRYQDSSDIYGIFTVADLDAAQNSIFASNCYAALAELDYYSHEGSRYNLSFPGDAHNSDLKNASPFRWVDILSMSSSEPDVSFRGGGGLSSLHGTIGLNLFCNVVTPLMGARAAEWSNYPAQCSGFYNELNRDGHVYRLNTFGISAFWYPKHRIARGVAAKIGQDFCDRYLATPQTGVLHIEKDVKENIETMWNSLLEGLLYDKELGVNLRNKVGDILQSHKNHLFRSKNIEYELLNIPKANPLPREFQSGGEFTLLISGQLPKFRKDLYELIDTLRNKVAAQALSYGQQYFKKVSEFFQNWLKRAPITFPQIHNLSGVGMTLRVLKQIEEDRWLRHIGLPSKVRKRLMERLLKDARDEYIRQLGLLRDFLVREHVENLLQELKLEGGNDSQHSVIESLHHCKVEFKKQLEDAEKPSTNENIKILLTAQGTNLHERMKVEIEQIYTSISSRLDQNDWNRLERAFCKKPLREGQGHYNLFEFLRQEKFHIFDQLNSVFQREALRDMRTINVARLAQNNQNVPDEVLRQQYRRSSSFIEFAPHFNDADANRNFIKPSIVAADNKENAEKIRNRSREIEQAFKKSEGTGFEHLLIFFREEPLFALGDTALHTVKKSLYDEALQSLHDNQGNLRQHSIGLHTDHNTLRFDASYFLNVTKLREQFELAQELFRAEVFTQVNGTQRFIYDDEMGHTRFCNSEDFDNEFHELAHTHQTFARNSFTRKLRDVIHHLGAEEVNFRLGEYLMNFYNAQPNNLPTHAEQDRQKQKRIRLIQEFLPTFGTGQNSGRPI